MPLDVEGPRAPQEVPVVAKRLALHGNSIMSLDARSHVPASTSCPSVVIPVARVPSEESSDEKISSPVPAPAKFHRTMTKQQIAVEGFTAAADAVWSTVRKLEDHDVITTKAYDRQLASDGGPQGKRDLLKMGLESRPIDITMKVAACEGSGRLPICLALNPCPAYIGTDPEAAKRAAPFSGTNCSPWPWSAPSRLSVRAKLLSQKFRGNLEDQEVNDAEKDSFDLTVPVDEAYEKRNEAEFSAAMNGDENDALAAVNAADKDSARQERREQELRRKGLPVDEAERAELSKFAKCEGYEAEFNAAMNGDEDTFGPWWSECERQRQIRKELDKNADKNAADKNAADKNDADKNAADKNDADKNDADKNTADKNAAEKWVRLGAVEVNVPNGPIYDALASVAAALDLWLDVDSEGATAAATHAGPPHYPRSSNPYAEGA